MFSSLPQEICDHAVESARTCLNGSLFMLLFGLIVLHVSYFGRMKFVQPQP